MIKRQPPPIRRSLVEGNTGQVTKMWAQWFDSLIKELEGKVNVGTPSAVTADTTITDNDGLGEIQVTTGDVDITITLPTLADNEAREIYITKVDSGSGTVIIDGEGAETINGSATLIITSQYSTAQLKAGTVEWIII